MYSSIARKTLMKTTTMMPQQQRTKLAGGTFLYEITHPTLQIMSKDHIDAVTPVTVKKMTPNVLHTQSNDVKNETSYRAWKTVIAMTISRYIVIRNTFRLRMYKMSAIVSTDANTFKEAVARSSLYAADKTGLSEV